MARDYAHTQGIPARTPDKHAALRSGAVRDKGLQFSLVRAPHRHAQAPIHPRARLRARTNVDCVVEHTVLRSAPDYTHFLMKRCAIDAPTSAQPDQEILGGFAKRGK